MKKQKGFTLIEVLVVVSIIGLLASATMVAMTNARKKARDIIRIADIKQLGNAVNLYYDAHGYYPLGSVDDAVGFDDSQTGDFLPELVSEGYMAKPLRDPGKWIGFWWLRRNSNVYNNFYLDYYCGENAPALTFFWLEQGPTPDFVITNFAANAACY